MPSGRADTQGVRGLIPDKGKEKTVSTAALVSRSRDVNVYYSTFLFSVVAIAVRHGFVWT